MRPNLIAIVLVAYVIINVVAKQEQANDPLVVYEVIDVQQSEHLTHIVLRSQLDPAARLRYSLLRDETCPNSDNVTLGSWWALETTDRVVNTSPLCVIENE